MYKTDIIVIGAGVVGLAVAEKLSAVSQDVIILERNKSFGQETSSRNSEVIHAGIYYSAGSLKAEMCLKGRDLLYAFCEKKSVPHKKIGKLIVATEKDEIESLEQLYADGCRAGATGLSLIDREEISKIEPNIRAIAAIYSNETGILDSHVFMNRLFNIAKGAGASLALDSEVLSIKKTGDGYEVTVKAGSGTEVLSAKIVINSAGLDADLVAAMAGIDVAANGYEIQYCKGQYFRVSGKKAGLVNRLIYPIPEHKAGGLGIHATMDLAGGLRLGPDHEYMRSRDKDYSSDQSRGRNFYNSVKRFLPFIEADDIAPDTAGIRPKVKSNNGEFRDFIIKEEKENGLPGFIDLIGIESPGLTGALAIAERVGQLVKDCLK